MIFLTIGLIVLKLSESSSFCKENVLESTRLETESIEIQDHRLHSSDEVFYEPDVVHIEQTSIQSNISESLKKLPGVSVMSASGVGSLTTVISPYALNSDSSQLSVDSFPIINPTGSGFNLSLLPVTFVESLDSHSPQGDSGKINFQTLSPSKRKTTPIRASLVTGFASDIQSSIAYRGSSFVFGINQFQSQGNFNYINPETNQRDNRQNNKAQGIGSIAKYKTQLRNEAEIELLHLNSFSQRTNPGPISFPSSDRENDLFLMGGLRMTHPKAFASNFGYFAGVSANLAQIKTTEPTLDTKINTLGSSQKLGLIHKIKSEKNDITYSSSTGVDRQSEDLTRDLNDQDLSLTTQRRSVISLFHNSEFRFKNFELKPLIRRDLQNTFNKLTKASVFGILHIDSDTYTDSSFSYSEVNPSLTALLGLKSQGFELIPNQNLKSELSHTYSIGAGSLLEKYKLSFYSQVFLSEIQNRNQYASTGFTTGQYLNIDRSSLFGALLDVKWSPLQPFYLRAAGNVSRAWDRSTGGELPYKPRWSGLLTSNFNIYRGLSFQVSQEFLGSRKVNIHSDQTLGVIHPTQIQLDYKFKESLAYFRVSNILDVQGTVTPGYPSPGRSYWLGYSFGHRGI